MVSQWALYARGRTPHRSPNLSVSGDPLASLGNALTLCVYDAQPFRGLPVEPHRLPSGSIRAHRLRHSSAIHHHATLLHKRWPLQR